MLFYLSLWQYNFIHQHQGNLFSSGKTTTHIQSLGANTGNSIGFIPHMCSSHRKLFSMLYAHINGHCKQTEPPEYYIISGGWQCLVMLAILVGSRVVIWWQTYHVTFPQHQTWCLDDHFIAHFCIPLYHAIVIRLIKSFVHLEISNDNLFHSTLQRSCEKRIKFDLLTAIIKRSLLASIKPRG